MSSQKKLDFDKELIIKSKIGLNNAGESCYMASIIQILIHLEKFLDALNKNNTQNNLYKEFFKFLNKIEKKKCSITSHYQISYNYIEIKQIANIYHSINHKFKGTEGNNPMTFFNEFISDLNKNILSLFKGEKKIELIKNENNTKSIEENKENFIFYLVTLDKNNNDLTTYFLKNLNEEKEFENEKEEKIKESITLFPEILVINLELEIKDYKPEKKIYLPKNETESNYQEYKLKAINKYSDVHSIA